MAYFQAVAASSDRVAFVEHGRTHEGRPLVHAVVTSPHNHSRLRAIQQANRRLSDVADSIEPATLEDMPAIVILGYSVHGNEASGTEASLLTLHHLAAGTGADVESLLDQLVVIVDPMLNPDGRDRFVGWVNHNRGAAHTTDPQDREHQEPWPGGRTNHYWFDLNRDWLPARQPETRARLRLYHEWRPQLVADFHEMGGDGTYFFQPGIPSRTHPNTPARNQELTAMIAGYHAQALDRLGQLYFSEEVFDDFYYGKGSSYPDVNGAVGILFEQASSRARETETENGPLTYAVTVRNQFATSISTLSAARDLRLDLLSHQVEFFAGARRFAEQRGVHSYILGLETGQGRTIELARLLRRHRIRIYQLGGTTSVSGRRFEPGQALVVPAGQPQARLIDAILSSQTTFTDSLFYDVSAWTLPYALDVEVWPTDRGVPEGPEWSGEVTDVGGPTSLDPGAVAFITEWDGLAAAQYLGRVQRGGVAVRLMMRPFSVLTTGGLREYGAGALVVPAQQSGLSRDSIRALVVEAAAFAETEVSSASSALTPEGPDLGGASSTTLRMPTLALLTGPGTSSNRAGEVWEFVSSYLGLPISLLDLDQLGRHDLTRYDVLLHAGGRGPDSALNVLRPWLREGGRLIAMGSAVNDVVEAGLIDLTERPFALDSLTAGRAWSERRAARGAHMVAGTILNTELDESHPLAFGIGGSVPTFRTHSTFFDADTPDEVVGRYSQAPLLAGYISAARLESAAGSISVVTRKHGRGVVILILDEPVFRGFWRGSARLLSNSVFFGGSF